MFKGVLVVIVCVLGILCALGPKQQQTSTQRKSSGTVTSAKKDGPKESIKKINTTQEGVDRRLASIKVPTKMLKNGEVQKLSSEQRKEYAVLAAFFRHDPVMLKVAACESSLRHSLPNGRLNVSPDGYDVGTFQVRVPVHLKELGRYGLNPADFAHNVAFATHLYQRDGLRPWKSSQHCWQSLRFIA